MKDFKPNTNLCEIYLQIRNRLNKKTEKAKVIESIFSIYEKIEDVELRRRYLKVLLTLCNKFDKNIKLLNDKQKNSFIMKALEDHFMVWLHWNLPHSLQSNSEEQQELIGLMASHIYNATQTMFKVERKKSLNRK